ncbi:MAG: M3 family oligoendopeptidase [Longicatena sp.]
MNTYEWSLDALYKGYEDPKFKEDMKQLHALHDELETFTTTLNTQSVAQAIKQSIALLEKECDLSYRLRMYTVLRQSVDTSDTSTLGYLNMINSRISSFSMYRSQIKEYLAHIDNIDCYIEQDDTLKEYSFMLHALKDKASHALSKEEEGLLASVSQTSVKAFSDMYYHLTSNVTTECLGKTMTLTQVKNLCHSTRKQERKEAFICEMKAYESIKEPLAFSVNNIKRHQLMEARLRGYQDPLDKMLQDSFMKKETLDAMYAAVDKYLPKFHEYLRTKASMLGYENGLPWYDIYATIGESTMSFSMEDCERYILKHFKTFSNDLYDMTKRAMDEHWMDYPSHAGKQSGAFCENLAWIKQSRIITNYGDTLSDVITVAHELGHAYHGMMVEDERPLNREYCMPLAETASTFNENIMYNALIQDADEKNKLFLIDTQLSALCQNICDITTRYTFEKAVFDQCESKFLFASDLQELMLDAEKKCFGNGLDPEWLHPFRWITKVHYYIPDIAFYNFPYTFGALFSRGLYAMYEQEKEAFLPKYRALLKASTTNTVEDCARIAGIDLSKPEFWETSLASITKQMDMFLELAKGQ